ncbi:hypothetical protein F443_22871 [Phytophthora nicotianae P1569]|uniref:Uncharacterized protein n=1 Tax=Phytophthora nicotianae P1569 TaxID=1317065 RepID=V9DSZ0_PHYNI|nr:hypothetical protein F443_22871 [Phytophthora nicotianae P1569]
MLESFVIIESSAKELDDIDPFDGSHLILNMASNITEGFMASDKVGGLVLPLTIKTLGDSSGGAWHLALLGLSS